MGRRRYTAEYKREVVELSHQCDKPVEMLAEELGIPANNIYRWRRQFAESPQHAFATPSVQTPQELEISRLKRELRVAQQERDILKKALTFFASENR